MPSGRQSHEAKITVYLTPDEQADLEQFKVDLMRKGVIADRGKIVRAALEFAMESMDDEAINRLLKES